MINSSIPQTATLIQACCKDNNPTAKALAHVMSHGKSENLFAGTK